MLAWLGFLCEIHCGMATEMHAGEWGWLLSCVRLNVDERVFDTKVGLPESRSDTTSDSVSFFDGGLTIDFDVDLNKISGAAFSNPAFLHGDDPVDFRRHLSDLSFERLGRSDIENVASCHFEQSQTTYSDDRARDERGPIIRRFITGAADERDADADNGCQ